MTEKAACPVLYVYRLVIEYPEGVDWRNPPPNWEPIFIPPDDETSFQWPRERRYLSKRGADDRAQLLRSYGCTVTVERSEPVAWPSGRVNTDSAVSQ